MQQATTFGPSCVQEVEGNYFYRYIAETLGQDPKLVPLPGPSSENCLFLNVWTPNLGGKDLKPVMVWIHGGANAVGTAVGLQTDGANLARKGVVVVSLNYRLNLFGFLAHPALTAESEHGSSGNYALLDQIAALKWVQQNAAAFGGDPGRVTVFGESAGGTNITYLLASPLARGLFHRAVIESGGYAVSDFRSLARGGGGGQELRGGARRGGLEGRRSRRCARRPLRNSVGAWLRTKKLRTQRAERGRLGASGGDRQELRPGRAAQGARPHRLQQGRVDDPAPILAQRHPRRLPPGDTRRLGPVRRSGAQALPGDD